MASGPRCTNLSASTSPPSGWTYQSRRGSVYVLPNRRPSTFLAKTEPVRETYAEIGQGQRSDAALNVKPAAAGSARQETNAS
jgi:hypothetical protein